MNSAVSFDQHSELFNSPLEFYPRGDRSVLSGRWRSAQWIQALVNWRRRVYGLELQVNERIVEYPMVLRWLPEAGSVLDVGAASSLLAIQMASLGLSVTAVDARPYPLSHPNLAFYRSDLFAFEPAEEFDAISCVSVLEHVGVQYPCGKDDCDLLLVQKLMGWLKPSSGRLILSVPYGAAGETGLHRIYDDARLQRLCQGFRTDRVAGFARIAGAWQPTTLDALAQTKSEDLPVNGVALIQLAHQNG